LGFLMNQKIEDKISVIKDCLQAAGQKVAQKDRILRTRLDNGFIVDIFPLKGTPDHIRVRLKIEDPDSRSRRTYVDSTHNSLSFALNGTAAVAPFSLARKSDGVHIYLSVLKLKTVADDAPIEINEDAIEIIDEEASAEDPALKPEPVCSSDPDDEADSDDLAPFELDFGSGRENRIKVVKSLAEEALENLETVDSKTLRQSLDMMGLKRSSAVRLAVTRIFRSALEISELEKTVENEAKRILTAGDRAELQEVKSSCGNGFLEPVINMLWQEVFK